MYTAASVQLILVYNNWTHSDFRHYVNQIYSRLILNRTNIYFNLPSI